MKTRRKTGLQLALIAGFLLYVSFMSISVTSFSQGPNNRNVSVDTRVNITQSYPVVTGVNIEGGETNITLNAGTARVVICNVSAYDYNGGSTLTANATFYANATSTWDAADDNNTHYTNSSCAITGTNNYLRNFSCSFPVMYYANVDMWDCYAIVTDDYNFTDDGWNETHIDELLALNVTTLIDYGNLAVGDTSDPQEANVTNLGNVDINVTVQGYGAALGDGLSFVCDVGNISVEYEKFNVTNGGQDPLAYLNLSTSYQQIPQLTIPQQTLDDTQEINETYWLLVVPPNPFGLCNGTVVFQAEAS